MKKYINEYCAVPEQEFFHECPVQYDICSILMALVYGLVIGFFLGAIL